MRRNIVHILESLVFRIYSPFNFLSLEDVDQHIDELEQKIRNSGYDPEIAVGIMRDGNYIANKLAARFNAEKASVGVSHYTIRLGPLEINDILGAYRVDKLLGYKPKVKVTQSVDKSLNGKRVLVVDDDSASGLTLQVAVDYLATQNPSDIKTATLLSHYGNNIVDYVACNLSREEFYGRRRILPWARFSPKFNDVN